MTVSSPGASTTTTTTTAAGCCGDAATSSAIRYPDWVEELQDDWGERLRVPEWEDDADDENDGVAVGGGGDDGSNNGNGSYRSKNGWRGRDLVHDRRSPVRITDYFVKYGKDGGGAGTSLTGICVFTDRAESHRGFCHGGSMTSLVDDAVGWCAFCASGLVKPWSGFTVQINASLRKPVPIGSVLLVRAEIVNVERRKVSVRVKIVDPLPSYSSSDPSSKTTTTTTEMVHAEGEGLVVLNRGVLPGT